MDIKLIYYIPMVLALTGCASSKLIHESKYSITYEHRDDKYSTLNDSEFYKKQTKKDALKKCNEKGFKSAQITNSQCTQYCSKKHECVCITNFVCQ